MSNRDAYQKEQFEKAGEQAAQVFGRFMSIASEFAAEMGRHTQEHRSKSDADQSVDRSEFLRETGEQLRQMREAAGYTLDRFAETLQNEIDQPDLNRADVCGKVKAVESGSEALPGDWVKQVAMLLSSRDSKQFFERLQECYETNGSAVAASNDEDADTPECPILHRRAARFSEIFAEDSDLSECTEEEYEKLYRFIEKNYQEAKALLITK